MKQEILQLPNGEELTRDELIEREHELELTQLTDSQLYESDQWNDVKRYLHYIGFNVLCFAALIAFALLCPKCSDADDRALGLPQPAKTSN